MNEFEDADVEKIVMVRRALLLGLVSLNFVGGCSQASSDDSSAADAITRDQTAAAPPVESIAMMSEVDFPADRSGRTTLTLQKPGAYSHLGIAAHKRTAAGKWQQCSPPTEPKIGDVALTRDEAGLWVTPDGQPVEMRVLDLAWKPTERFSTSPPGGYHEETCTVVVRAWNKDQFTVLARAIEGGGPGGVKVPGASDQLAAYWSPARDAAGKAIVTFNPAGVAQVENLTHFTAKATGCVVDRTPVSSGPSGPPMGNPPVAAELSAIKFHGRNDSEFSAALGNEARVISTAIATIPETHKIDTWTTSNNALATNIIGMNVRFDAAVANCRITIAGDNLNYSATPPDTNPLAR